MASTATTAAKPKAAAPKGKSHKSQKRDRPSHSSKTGAVAGARKGGAGRGNWGALSDDIVDAKSAEALADDTHNGNGGGSGSGGAWMPAAVEVKKFSEGAANLSNYKKAIKDAAEELLVSGDTAVFVSIAKRETRAVFGQELAVVLFRLALEKPSALRSKLLSMPKHLVDQGVLTPSHMVHSYRKLFNILDDLLLDAPTAEQQLVAWLEQSVKDNLVDRKTADALVAARRLLADGAVVRAGKARIREIVANYYNSGDIVDAKRSIVELKAPHLGFEVVKQLIQAALDRKDQQRELASVFISELSDVLGVEEIGKGFSVLLSRVEDLFLDVPDILRLLSAFLARAIRDEALPPAFLLQADLPAGDQANQVIQQASKLGSGKGASLRLAKIWGAVDDINDKPASEPTNGGNAPAAVASLGGSGSGSGKVVSADGKEVSKSTHRNAMRRLRKKKLAAAIARARGDGVDEAPQGSKPAKAPKPAPSTTATATAATIAAPAALPTGGEVKSSNKGAAAASPSAAAAAAPSSTSPTTASPVPPNDGSKDASNVSKSNGKKAAKASAKKK